MRSAVSPVLILLGICHLAALSGCDASTSARNQKPQALLTFDGRVRLGEDILLDGRASFDPEGASLTYNWTILHKPGTAALSAAARRADVLQLPTDLPGTWLVQLVVHDGLQESDPTLAQILVQASSTPAAQPPAPSSEDPVHPVVPVLPAIPATPQPVLPPDDNQGNQQPGGPSQGEYVYWIDQEQQKIQRTSLAGGSPVEDLPIQVSTLAGGLALDPVGKKIFWSETGLLLGIHSANLDGSGGQTVVVQPNKVVGLSFDTLQRRLYFVNHDESTLQRWDGSISGIELLPTDLKAPLGIALDPTNGKVYWTEAGPPSSIKRSNLDGSGEEMLLDSISRQPAGIAVDPVGGKMYWIDAEGKKVMRANLDGKGEETLIATGLKKPFGIVLHAATQRLIFSDLDARAILRANLDGSALETLITIPGKPASLVLGPGANP
jgi:hypothetical protein